MSQRVSGIEQFQNWRLPFAEQSASGWLPYVQTATIILVCTGLNALLFPHFEPVNLILVYMLGVVVTAAYWGRGPSIFASFLSVAVFDFFFVPPYLTLAVSDTQYIITFIFMLTIALLVSNLTLQIKQLAHAGKDRERVTTSLYALSDEFANSSETLTLVHAATHYISDVFHMRTVILLPEAHTNLVKSDDGDLLAHEQGVAQWAFEHGQMAGNGTDTLPSADGMYLPLATSRRIVGVLGIYPARSASVVGFDLQMLTALARQTALAIERSHLAEETEQVKLQVEAERLRNTLLSSVSHDIRTPLASVTGAVSSLLENEDTLSQPARHELAQVAYEEAKRLNKLVGNILQMTRLESGNIHVNKEWQPLEEVVGIVLNRLGDQPAEHPVKVHLPDDLPLIPIDGILIEQVLINLFENAIRYTPAGTAIDFAARDAGNELVVEVADHGPGLRPGEEERVFNKFYRAQPANSGGVGLGLTICRGIIELHDGRIWAQNRPGGGAIFGFALPLPAVRPMIEIDE